MRPAALARSGAAEGSAIPNGNGRDVKQQMKAKREFCDRRWQVRDLLNALPAAIYTTDAAGRITSFNQAAVEFSGRTPEIGSDQWCVTWRLYWSDGRPMAHGECPMAKALKEDRPIRGAEAIAERPDGTRVPFMAYPTPLHDASGRVVGAVNMLVDLTAAKEVDEARSRLNEMLEQRVQERTRQLTETLTRLRERERRFRAESLQRQAEQAQQEQRQRDREARHEAAARRVDEETRASLFMRVLQAQETKPQPEAPVPVYTARQNQELELEQAAGRRALARYAQRNKPAATTAAQDQIDGGEKVKEEDTRLPGFKTL